MIEKDVTRTEVHQAERNHETNQNDHALYDTSNMECKEFIMEVVNKTWYKELKDPDTFYMIVTDLKLLDHVLLTTSMMNFLHSMLDVSYRARSF